MLICSCPLNVEYAVLTRIVSLLCSLSSPLLTIICLMILICSMLSMPCSLSLHCWAHSHCIAGLTLIASVQCQEDIEHRVDQAACMLAEAELVFQQADQILEENQKMKNNWAAAEADAQELRDQLDKSRTVIESFRSAPAAFTNSPLQAELEQVRAEALALEETAELQRAEMDHMQQELVSVHNSAMEKMAALGATQDTGGEWQARLMEERTKVGELSRLLQQARGVAGTGLSPEGGKLRVSGLLSPVDETSMNQLNLESQLASSERQLEAAQVALEGASTVSAAHCYHWHVCCVSVLLSVGFICKSFTVSAASCI